MNVEEYKKLGTKHIVFPSGLELNIALPSAQTVLGIFGENLTNGQMADRMIAMSVMSDESGVLDVSDIKDIDDYAYLATTVSGFFTSPVSSSPKDSIQEQPVPEPCVGSLSEDSKNTD